MTPPTSRQGTNRRAAWRRGRRAEWRAMWWLRLKGYAILARNLKTPVGELDILARRGGVLAAVEVKARPTLAEAAMAVPERQWRRCARAVDWWLARAAKRGADPAPNGLRYDCVLIAPGRWPHHMRDAWRPKG